jgi:hypothetical protein
MATVKEFVRKNPSEVPGPAHPCDDPSLSPLQFLHAVYHDRTLPMATRIKAASALLPFTNSVPRPTNSVPRCKIVIGGLGPYDQGLSPEDPEQINSETQPFPLRRSAGHQPQSESQGPSNIETNSYPPTFIDLSSPLTLDEVRAAINRLRPDLAGLPIEEPHLCPCGRMITGSYSCCERSRDPSKLN